MANATNEFMLLLLQACAERAPEPIYPVEYAREKSLDRALLDDGLEELRRRGLIKLTDWVKDLGQGRTLTEAGWAALTTKDLAPVNNDARVAAIASRGSTVDRAEIVWDAISEPKPPWICWALLTCNIVFFFYGAVFAWQNNLVVTDYLWGSDGVARTRTIVAWELGALYRPSVLPPRNVFFPVRPEFERLLICCFLHFGILHFGMNMYFLVTLGGLVESMWGKWRFLAIYLIAGVVSSCVVLSIEMIQDRYALTVGASGSLYGVFASLIVWFTVNRRYLPDEFLQQWSRTLAINLLIMLSMNLLPGISWQAHLGGAIGGALTAFLFHVQRLPPNFGMRMLTLLGLPMIPAFFFLLALWQAGWI